MNAIAQWEDVPLFDSEEAEAAFWADNQIEMRLMESAIGRGNEAAESVSISLRIDPRMLAKIKRLARSRYLNYQSMIKQWLSERLEQEMHQKNAMKLPPTKSARAFTLVELLVVMGIIGVLAGLTVGLVSVAARKGKTSRMEKELNEIATLIENYKSEIGSYPKDNPSKPGLNGLFYELSGVTYSDGAYSTAGQPDRLGIGFVAEIFNAQGFGNAARPGDDLKFTHNFKPDQHKKIKEGNAVVEVLVAPLPGPGTRPAADGTLANPWNYDNSSKTRHNLASFDLWVEINVGNAPITISNW